jgi:hypothetical protein
MKKKLAKLQKDIKTQEGKESVAISRLSPVNQTLTPQKVNAEKTYGSGLGKRL